jgi:cell division septum initiation protein DivIVA
MDLRAILLEHKLKTSAEANEEYKKQIVELQEKVKGKADWGRMETSSA